MRTFSILERIDVGETVVARGQAEPGAGLSVSSNGSTWVKLHREARCLLVFGALSVSSNGSTWVKRNETTSARNFCILSVSSNGSTWVKPGGAARIQSINLAFSILERIDVGETTCSS